MILAILQPQMSVLLPAIVNLIFHVVILPVYKLTMSTKILVEYMEKMFKILNKNSSFFFENLFLIFFII